MCRYTGINENDERNFVKQLATHTGDRTAFSHRK